MTKRKLSKYKSCRRLGVNLWGNSKDPYIKRNYPPGVHGPSGGRKLTVYGTQLRAKQIVRTLYDISEKQLRNLYRKAIRKRGDSGENLIALLESRLMTFVYRAKLAPTIFAARQMVGHGHILVNNRRVNIPSYTLSAGDVVTVKSASSNMKLLTDAMDGHERAVPEYIKLHIDERKAVYETIPLFQSIPQNSIIPLNFVIEYYSS